MSEALSCERSEARARAPPAFEAASPADGDARVVRDQGEPLERALPQRCEPGLDQTPIERRRAVWDRLGNDLKPGGLGAIAREIGLDELDATLTTILEGGLTGRTIVDVRR